MAPRLFVYGTLQDERLVEQLLGRRLPWRPAVLEGYRRAHDPSIGYPIVRPAPGARVEGRLLEGLDRAALAALDAYEGREYRRIPVRVQTGEERTVDAEVYVPAETRIPSSGRTDS